MMLKQEREACVTQFEVDRKMANFLEVKFCWREEIV